jgi:zinc protease
LTDHDRSASPSDRRGRGVALVASACIALVLLAAPASAQHFGAEGFTLGNGMQVVVVPNHRVPAVVQMVWYKLGAAEDPVGKSDWLWMRDAL